MVKFVTWILNEPAQLLCKAKFYLCFIVLNNPSYKYHQVHFYFFSSTSQYWYRYNPHRSCTNTSTQFSHVLINIVLHHLTIVVFIMWENLCNFDTRHFVSLRINHIFTRQRGCLFSSCSWNDLRMYHTIIYHCQHKLLDIQPFSPNKTDRQSQGHEKLFSSRCHDTAFVLSCPNQCLSMVTWTIYNHCTQVLDIYNINNNNPNLRAILLQACQFWFMPAMDHNKEWMLNCQHYLSFNSLGDIYTVFDCSNFVHFQKCLYFLSPIWPHDCQLLFKTPL